MRRGELFFQNVSRGRGAHYVFGFWQLHTLALTAWWLPSPRDGPSRTRGRGRGAPVVPDFKEDLPPSVYIVHCPVSGLPTVSGSPGSLPSSPLQSESGCPPSWLAAPFPLAQPTGSPGASGRLTGNLDVRSWEHQASYLMTLQSQPVLFSSQIELKSRVLARRLPQGSE